uniref:Uncharacterized protein n=1 Tax=Vespula pensylvanica TaxID=30213 RepID=A0A834NHR8_VESPE|nr:hypothetical protein H0235_013247 [Vespula pensylvanica]
MRIASQERVYGYIKILQDSSDKPARLPGTKILESDELGDEPISGDMPTHLGEVDSLIDVVPSTEKHYSSHWTEVKETKDLPDHDVTSSSIASKKKQCIRDQQWLLQSEERKGHGVKYLESLRYKGACIGVTLSVKTSKPQVHQAVSTRTKRIGTVDEGYAAEGCGRKVGGYVSRWAPHLQLPNRVTVMDYRLERSRGSGSVFDSRAGAAASCESVLPTSPTPSKAARETAGFARGNFIFKAQADVFENAIAKYNTLHYLYPVPEKRYRKR